MGSVRRTLAVLAASTLVLAGCSDSEDPAASSAPPTTASMTPSIPVATSPAPTTPPPTQPPATQPPAGPQPATPAEAVTALTGMLGSEFEAAPDGMSLQAPTFDQCNFEYDTERLRKARSTIVRGGSSGAIPTVSVQAVAYDFEDTATLAVTEVRTAVEGCTTGESYTELPAADQEGLTEDKVAKSLKTADGKTANFYVVRRGVVVVVVIGTDTVSAGSTARTMALLLSQYPASAVGL